MEMPLSQTEESTPQGDQDPPSNKDVEMWDDTLQGAEGGSTSPVNKEEDDMLDEPLTPQTQVISEMQNLSVGSHANLTQSQMETWL